MLLSLRIENFALIDQLELEFGPGLNILTGETGAGKSIILDAIDVVLGGKVSSRMIRAGTEKAVIEATFRVNPFVAEWLNQQEIDTIDETDLVCSRELATGQGSLRSRSRLNGILVNRLLMDNLRDRLVEITAQGQTLQLTTPAVQRELLDLYGGSPLLLQRDTVSIAFSATQETLQALEKRRQSEQQRLQRFDLLEYQAKEFDSANLSDPDEMEQLEQERQRLSHAVELQQLSYQVYQELYQNDADEKAAADLLSKAEASLTDMVRYDASLQPILEIVSGALEQVMEAGHQINAYGDSLESDPSRLSEVEDRIRALKQICRKYGPTLSEAIAYNQCIQAELAELKGGGQSLEELEKNYQICQEKLTQVCAELTQLRRHTAAELEGRLVEELKPLAMEKVQFQVKMVASSPTAAGADLVTFYFSPNQGEQMQPLAAIASGGEMSRFLLALKACFSQIEAAGTLIFDEIDVGVSGRVAQAIAEKLHQLGQHHQVLCVTHQPLVAAMADRHFRVDKQVIEGGNTEWVMGNGPIANSSFPIIPADVRTVIRVSVLDNHLTRREELAQLAGGKSASDAIAFADSLLTQAANRRQS